MVRTVGGTVVGTMGGGTGVVRRVVHGFFLGGVPGEEGVDAMVQDIGVHVVVDQVVPIKNKCGRIIHVMAMDEHSNHQPTSPGEN